MVYKNMKKKIIAMLFGMFLFTLSNDVFAERLVRCERIMTLNSEGSQFYQGQGSGRVKYTGFLFWLYVDLVNAVLIYLPMANPVRRFSYSYDETWGDYYKEEWSDASYTGTVGGGKINIDAENFKKDVCYVSPDVPSKQLPFGLYFW